MSSDIDFDELDKAVSSLMGGVGPEKSDDAPKQKTLTISGTLKPDEDPAYAKLDEVARTIGSETLTTDGEKTVTFDDAAQVATPDVVVSPAPVPVATQPVEAPAPVTSAPVVSVAPPAASPMPAAQRPSTGRFMDVVHPSSAMRGAATLDATPPIRTTPVQPSATPGVETTEAPLTPFLPDAKVEKRPLGGSGAIPSPFDDVPTDQLGATQESKVEETSTINSEPRQIDASSDTQPVLDASAFEQEGTAESAELTAVESTEVTPDTTPKAGSIASVESGDTEHLKNPQSAGQQGAIYDVDNQPQPLAHPTKQKSGWGTVVIIVIIIILAAAVGAAAYFILGLGV